MFQKVSSFECIDIHKAFLRFYGLWPTDDGKRSKRSFIQSFRNVYLAVVALVTMFLMCLSIPLGIYGTWMDPFTIAEGTAIEIVAALTLLKLGCLLTYYERYQKLVGTLEAMHKRDRLSPERNASILDKTQWFTNMVIFHHIGAMSAVVFFVTGQLPYLLDSRTLYFWGWYPYDVSATPLFELTLTSWALLIMPSAIGIITVVDSFLMAIYVQIIGQLKILQYNLKNMYQLSSKKVEENEEVKRKYSLKSMEIRKHSAAKQIARENNKTILIPKKDTPKTQLLVNSLIMNPATVKIETKHKYLHSRISKSRINTIKSETKNVTKEGRTSGGRARKSKVKSIPYQQTWDRNSTGKTVKEDAINQEMDRRIKTCVRHHQEIIKLISEAENEFDVLILAQFIANLLGVTDCLLLVTQIAPALNMKVFSIIALTIVATIELSMFCWLSTRITEEAFNLKEAIYNCEWYGASESFKRSMRIIISRSNFPVELKGGGFIQLNIESFCCVMKSAYSYYTSIGTVVQNGMR